MDALTRLSRQVADEIPLARAAGIELSLVADDTIEAHAPFEPNRNLHGTAFGGSLYVVALVCGFAQTVWLAQRAGLAADVVVQRAEARYNAPLRHALVARPAAIDLPARERFVTALECRGRARLTLTLAIAHDGETAFELAAGFVARVPAANTASGNTDTGSVS